MRILLDTNVLLDVLLNRTTWATSAAQIWDMCIEGHFQGYVCASSCTDIFYIARRLTNLVRARAAVRLCLESFEICAVDHRVLVTADSMPGSDFEDNVEMACAILNDIDVIITRDPDDFKASSVRAMTTDEFLQWFTADKSGDQP